MRTLEILDNAGNVINTIMSTDAFAEAHFPGHWRPRSEDGLSLDFRPAIIITGITPDEAHSASTLVQDTSDVTCPVGSVLTVHAELRDPEGNLIPLSDSFRMPLRARDGREKVLLAVMASGVITITVPLRESGLWSVAESTINESLPPERQMKFAGINVFVIES